MKELFIDLESIPSQSKKVKEEIRNSISPPGNIKKKESIDKWMEEKAESASEEKWLKTSLDGTRGQIISIAYAGDNDEVQAVYGDNEKILLKEFFSRLAGCGNPTLILHGSKDLFDLRFIFQRAVIHGIEPTFPLHQDCRYNGDRTFDTMSAWFGWGQYGSLDSICRALNIKSPKTTMKGSDVWKEYQAGNLDKIVEYNKDDVVALRQVYRRLTFTEGIVAEDILEDMGELL